MSAGLVMLVEDDPTLSMLYKNLLEKNEFQVLTAGDGQQALDLLGEGHRPHLLIMDVMMPVMDGIEACKQARPIIGSDVPILFLTALDDMETLRECIVAGGDDFVVKNGAPDLFLDRARHWAAAGHEALGGRSARSVAAANDDVDTIAEDLAKVARMVLAAQQVAGGEFGESVEQKIALMGYCAGAVDEIGSGNLEIKMAFQNSLRTVVTDTGVLSEGDMENLLDSWEELAHQSSFMAAFDAGRRDCLAGREAGGEFVPGGLKGLNLAA